MSDLFDLPFEEDRDDEGQGGRQHPPATEGLGGPRYPSTAGDRQPSVDNRRPSLEPRPRRDSPLPESPDPTAGPVRPEAASPRVVWTVTELTVSLRDLIESKFLEVWVEGELSNCKTWNTGHLYFTLKDKGAQLRGVIFRSALRYLKFKPGDGLRIIA